MRKLTIGLLLGSIFAVGGVAPAGAAPAAGISPQSKPAASTTHKSSAATSSKKKKSSHHHSSRREPFQKAPTPARISEIQTALSRGGYFEGEPNGKWDSNTVSAMQKFQSANGLNSSGKIDATTLQKLGLGSSTAGVDAPKPLKKTDPASASTAASHATSVANTNTATNTASNATPAPAASATSKKPPQN